MDDIDAFGALGERVGLLLHYADVRAMAVLTRRLAPFGVTPAKATAVVYVGLHEGCEQVALGRALGINAGSTMKVVDELERIGAVERRQGRDRRTKALHLTSSGKTLRAAIERVTAEHDAAVFGVLTPAELRQLRAALTKLRGDDLAADAAERTLLPVE